MNSPSPDLVTIDMALSREIIKEPREWRLDELEQQTRATIVPGSPRAHLDNAHKMLAKIADWRKIQLKAKQTAGGSSIGQRQQQGASSGGFGSNSSGQFSTDYDATGWLKVLVQRNGTVASTYVLENEDGVVTHIVAADRGVDLKPYLKSRVGIVGQMGFHQLLNTPHVTVQRITPLR